MPSNIEVKAWEADPATTKAGHVEIAREVLKRLGMTPANLADHYDQMFGLGYARIVEHPDQVLEVEYVSYLSDSQEKFVNGMRQRGWSVRLIRK